MKKIKLVLIPIYVVSLIYGSSGIGWAQTNNEPPPPAVNEPPPPAGNEPPPPAGNEPPPIGIGIGTEGDFGPIVSPETIEAEFNEWVSRGDAEDLNQDGSISIEDFTIFIGDIFGPGGPEGPGGPGGPEDPGRPDRGDGPEGPVGDLPPELAALLRELRVEFSDDPELEIVLSESDWSDFELEFLLEVSGDDVLTLSDLEMFFSGPGGPDGPGRGEGPDGPGRGEGPDGPGRGEGPDGPGGAMFSGRR